MTFGGKLQKLRKARDLTQEALAAEIGISRQALSKWESDTVLPDTENVLKLSDFFGVTTDYLLRDDRSQPVSTPPSSSDMPEEHDPLRPRGVQLPALLGCLLSLLSAIGLLIMGVLSSVKNCEIYYPQPDDGSGALACTAAKVGLAAFLETYHLGWLFILLLILVLVGLILALSPRFRHRKHN